MDAQIQFSSSEIYQITIRVDKHGNYMVPRYATDLIVDLLNHENLRWTVIDRNRRKTVGLDTYLQYLSQALDDVSNHFSFIYIYI